MEDALANEFNTININTPQQEYKNLCNLIDGIENGNISLEKVKMEIKRYYQQIDFKESVERAIPEHKLVMLGVYSNTKLLINVMNEWKESLVLELAFDVLEDIRNMTRDYTCEEGSFFEK